MCHTMMLHDSSSGETPNLFVFQTMVVLKKTQSFMENDELKANNAIAKFKKNVTKASAVVYWIGTCGQHGLYVLPDKLFLVCCVSATNTDYGCRCCHLAEIISMLENLVLDGMSAGCL